MILRAYGGAGDGFGGNGSGGGTGGGVGFGGDGFSGMDLLLRIALTAAVCRIPDKREQSPL